MQGQLEKSIRRTVQKRIETNEVDFRAPINTFESAVNVWKGKVKEVTVRFDRRLCRAVVEFVFGTNDYCLENSAKVWREKGDQVLPF